jgi:hypothetical protein
VIENRSEEHTMNPVVGPYAAAEAAYRRERIAADFHRPHHHHHHPIQTLGRALTSVQRRLEGV